VRRAAWWILAAAAVAWGFAFVAPSFLICETAVILTGLASFCFIDAMPKTGEGTVNAPAIKPDATPAQRAWAAFEFIRLHPESWDQSTYGRLSPEGKTRGCFAHHVVRMAGYPQVSCGLLEQCRCHVPNEALDEIQALSESSLATLREQHGASTRSISIHAVARELLGGDFEIVDLFEPLLTLKALERRIAAQFGLNPVQGAVDEVTSAAQRRAANEIQDLTYEILGGQEES